MYFFPKSDILSPVVISSFPRNLQSKRFDSHWRMNKCECKCGHCMEPNDFRISIAPLLATFVTITTTSTDLPAILMFLPVSLLVLNNNQTTVAAAVLVIYSTSIHYYKNPVGMDR